MTDLARFEVAPCCRPDLPTRRLVRWPGVTYTSRRAPSSLPRPRHADPSPNVGSAIPKVLRAHGGALALATLSSSSVSTLPVCRTGDVSSCASSIPPRSRWASPSSRLPAGAAIKAMTLNELMAITTDTVHVKDRGQVHVPSRLPFAGCVYTKLTVQGESLRTLEPVKHRPRVPRQRGSKDEFGVSEMPTLQDTRVGSEAVIFFKRSRRGRARPSQPHLRPRQRVPRRAGLRRPVVVGKGEGLPSRERQARRREGRGARTRTSS